MKHEVRRIDFSKSPAFFMGLGDEWNIERYPTLWAIGETDLFKGELVALFCSRKCPGRVVRKSHDFADELRIRGTPVIGGFQTPVEKMVFDVLLKGSQPIVLCPARGIQRMRIPSEWSASLDEGGLLIISPFGPRQRRASVASADVRNRFVAASAARLFFLHASAGSRTLSLAEVLLTEGRDIETFDMQDNEPLMRLGAKGVR